MIEYKCRKCGAEMSSPASKRGTFERCPACGELCPVDWQLSTERPTDAPARAVGKIDATPGGGGDYGEFVAKRLAGMEETLAGMQAQGGRRTKDLGIIASVVRVFLAVTLVSLALLLLWALIMLSKGV